MIDLFKVDSLEVTIKKLYNECVNNNFDIDIEEINVKDSYNRILAEDLVANVDVPAFDRSVVDGYAVIAKDTEAATEAAADDSASGSKGTINLWTFTDEVPGMVDKFLEANPDFGYDVNSTIIATTDGAYQPALDQALAAGGADAPDLYCAEEAFVLKYTQGDMAQFAAPYADLGIDVDSEISAAEIAPTQLISEQTMMEIL